MWEWFLANWRRAAERRRVRYWQDEAMTVPAGDGDRVRAVTWPYLATPMVARPGCEPVLRNMRLDFGTTNSEGSGE